MWIRFGRVAGVIFKALFFPTMIPPTFDTPAELFDWTESQLGSDRIDTRIGTSLTALEVIVVDYHDRAAGREALGTAVPALD